MARVMSLHFSMLGDDIIERHDAKCHVLSDSHFVDTPFQIFL